MGTTILLAGSVTGGYGNEAIGDNSAVFGGYKNMASGIRSSASDGKDDKATDGYNPVSGKFYDEASDYESMVSGEYLNKAEGAVSTVIRRKRKLHQLISVWLISPDETAGASNYGSVDVKSTSTGDKLR